MATKSSETPPTESLASTASVPALRPHLQTPEPAKRKRPWLWGFGALFGLVLLGVGLWQPWTTGPLAVAVEVAAAGPATRILAVNGRIGSTRSVEVKPLVSGTLGALWVAEGDRVSEGQDLAQVETAAQNSLIRQAVAGLDAALVSQEQARASYQRSLALGGTVARSTLETEERNLRAAEQEVARMQALLDQAQIALANHTSRAPFTGSVIAVNVEKGQAVSPSTVLMTFADLDDLRVETDVDEVYATQIVAGQTAVLQLAGETTTSAGHVSFVSSRVDAATGGLAVELVFDTPIKAPIGLTVTANIIVESRDSALTVPRTALATVAGKKGVFVLQGDKAEFRPLQVVDWPATRLIVTTGLMAGEAVIADAVGLSQGQTVSAEGP